MWNLYSEYTQLVYEMKHGRCNDDSPLGNTIPATNVPGRREPVKQHGVPAASFPMYKLEPSSWNIYLLINQEDAADADLKADDDSTSR